MGRFRGRYSVTWIAYRNQTLGMGVPELNETMKKTELILFYRYGAVILQWHLAYRTTPRESNLTSQAYGEHRCPKAPLTTRAKY